MILLIALLAVCIVLFVFLEVDLRRQTARIEAECDEDIARAALYPERIPHVRE